MRARGPHRIISLLLFPSALLGTQASPFLLRLLGLCLRRLQSQILGLSPYFSAGSRFRMALALGAVFLSPPLIWTGRGARMPSALESITGGARPSFSPYLKCAREGVSGCLSALGSCVSAVVELARPAPAGGGDVRSSIQVSLGMEQVSLPSTSETDSSQQDPGLSEGSQASQTPPSLASSSSLPVQCTTPWLSFLFLSY
jgi:hypothetical protein